MAGRCPAILLLVIASSVLVTPILLKPKPGEFPERQSVKQPGDYTEEVVRTEAANDAEPLPTSAPEDEDDAKDDEEVALLTRNAPKQSGSEAEKVNYAGAQVWKVSTERTGTRAIISRLRRRNLVSPWSGNKTYVDVMVKPEAIKNVTRLLKNQNIEYDVIIEDLQKVMEIENPPLDPSEVQLQDRRGHRMTWKQYHRLDDIYGFMEYLAKTYPSLISVKSIGKSHEGRDMKVLRISNGKAGNKAVFIDGGIHAREWISPATVTYFINQIAENFDVESDDVKNTDWYFLPVLNPDGYEFTHMTDRLWRKNRKPALPAGIRSCAGADLNRNFGYRWGGKGASTNPCSDTFRGSAAFSEPESKNTADFIKSLNIPFSAYLTYHSYGQYLLYPWGYDNVVPPDHKQLQAIGENIANTIKQTGGSQYRVGSSSGLLYAASGGSDDWAKAQGIKYAYTIELNDQGRYGFILPASYIEPVARENLAGLRTLLKQIHSE